MGILAKLFGPADPTRAWPAAIEGVLPEVNFTTRTFGSLHFEDGLDAASFLGRPDQIKITKYCQDLYYHRQGFQLAFEGGRFVEVQFHLLPEAGSRFKPCQPRAPGGVVLTPETSKQDLATVWGPPQETNDYGTYEIVQWLYGQFVSEFEYETASGKLAGWTVYLDE